jgi:hypothetical protein
MHFSQIIGKERVFLFLQQTSKVKKNMCAITLILGVLFGKKRIQNSKNS